MTLTPEEQAKKEAGYAAAELIKQNQSVGIGTGSTVHYLIEKLEDKVKNGLTFYAAYTSHASQLKGEDANFQTIEPETSILDIAIDGADAITESGWMIKGGGGALFREKILAMASHEMIVIVDESKWTTDAMIHEKAALPLEVCSFGLHMTLRHLTDMGLNTTIRGDNDALFVTDEKNHIIDVQLTKPIQNIEQFDAQLKSIPGVIETGLFYGCATKVITGYSHGKVDIKDLSR